jgi:hypothetical protein
MGNIKIQESNIDLTFGRTGKIAIFLYSGDGDPVSELNSAVSTYVGYNSYHQFIDINMDNPWIRVIMSDLNEMEQVDFDPLIHRLNND